MAIHRTIRLDERDGRKRAVLQVVEQVGDDVSE